MAATALLRLSAVEKLTGYKRSTIYRRIADPASAFPQPIRLGPRAIAWIESEVNDWIQARIRESRESAQ